MVWKRLPEDARKTILTALCFLGGTSACCRLQPPIICDPPPPPSVTPMICDPPPPPPAVVTVAPGQRFVARTVEVSPDTSQSGVTIRGSIVDQSGRGLGGLEVIIETGGQRTQAVSDYAGVFYTSGEPGTYTLSIAGDENSRVVLELEERDYATVEWAESWDDGQAPLPLAEIRTVGIAWLDGLTFAAESPWPGARYRWSVSGGKLVDRGEEVAWQPPAEPGRYLLQVVADWGRSGLAVDAVALTVEDDGSVTSG